jgi:hypothetical protein
VIFVIATMALPSVHAQPTLDRAIGDPPLLQPSDPSPHHGGAASSRPRSNVHAVPWQPIPGALSAAYARSAQDVALQDTRVQALLGQRYAFIATQETYPPKGTLPNRTAPRQIRLIYFSHTHNVAVEIWLSGLQVERVARRERYQPPEGYTEIEEAIRLAVADPRISGQLQGLQQDAILILPPAGRPGYGNRVLDVIFTTSAGLARYHALVDLTQQRVLVAEPSALPSR